MRARPRADVVAAGPVVEALEDRRLFSSAILSIGVGDSIFGNTTLSGVSLGSGNNFVDLNSSPTSQLVSLAPLSSGLPSQILQLPPISTGLQGFGSANAPVPTLHLVGSFRGSANVTGFGSTRFNFAVTRQRAGSITVSASFRRLGASFSGSAQVTFLGNRRFTFTLSKANDTIVVAGRMNRDGTISATFSGQLETRRLDGTFSARRLKA